MSRFSQDDLFFITALITAICVSTAGVIGFLGLIVPHALRRLGIHGHFLLITRSLSLRVPGFLLCSDVFARVIVRPSEIPVGIIMAMVGAPLFLYMARNQIARSGAMKLVAA